MLSNQALLALAQPLYRTPPQLLEQVQAAGPPGFRISGPLRRDAGRLCRILEEAAVGLRPAPLERDRERERDRPQAILDRSSGYPPRS